MLARLAGYDIRQAKVVRILRADRAAITHRANAVMRLYTLGGVRIEADPPLPPLGPRRMGLLAIVAAAGAKGVSRDQVLGLLWPDSTDDHARHTLAQNLYTLRRQTGRELIVATPELRLGPEMTSDIGDFRNALARSELAAAADLYTGDFLEGFYLTGAPEFERWVEEERARIRAAALRAHETLAARADEAGSHEEAIRLWRRLAELEPLSARYAAGVMRGLAALGDRPAALSHARAYEELVRRELESDPDPSIRDLAEALRRASPVSRRDPSPLDAAAAPPHPSPPAVAPEVARPVPIRTRRWLPAAAIVLAASVIITGVRLLRDDPAVPPVLAVGAIRFVGAADTAGLAPLVRDMLATSLASVSGLQVVANARLIELGGTDASPDALALLDAARRAGAQEVVEGELTQESDGLRLSLRRVAVGNGHVRGGFVVRASDRFAIVDSAAIVVARDVGLESPTLPATSRTPSVAAFALYEEGLRAWYRGETQAAWRFMSGALDRDSTFAMAAYYAWQAGQVILDEPARDQVRARASRLAVRAIERERLLIQGSAAELDAPIVTTLAIADTLTTRYPSDPDGHVLLGRARHKAGDFAGASAAFERVIATDSAAGLAGGLCRACTALQEAARNYLWWDSAAAAVRTSRRWIALDSSSSMAWWSTVEPLLRLGRRAEAEAALARAERLGGGTALPIFHLHRDLIRSGRYEELERDLAVEIRSASPAVIGEARWLWMFALRDQGRLAEALALARDGIVPGTSERHFDGPDALHVALLAFEMGRPLEAGAQFREDAANERRSTRTPGTRDRNVAWTLTLAATALAAAGDTAAVRALADTVQQTGLRSSFGRDPRLHHFLHGLLWQAQARHEEAVLAFRRALFSTTDGYTRINLELARSLLALGRPREAVAILQPVLRGGVDGANTYLTRTETHEMLADAFAAAGMADSARGHYLAVELAWRNADPPFLARWERARILARGN